MESNFIKSANLSKSPDDYFGLDAISVSKLKKLKVSPAHYKEAEDVVETDAMRFGSAYHCFILEPKKFENDYYVFNDQAICEALIGDGYKSPRSTKAYKEWEESEMRIIGEKSLIKKEEFERIKAMKERLFSHPYAKMLLTKGEPEVGLSGTITTMAGDINVKLKPDYIKSIKHIVVDLKTAADASLDGFTRAAADRDYHIQAAFYSDMIELMNGDNRAVTFIFIAQEKTKPYAFNLFEASPQFIAQGRYEYEMLLQLYKYCLDNNKWPGYQCFCPNRYGLLELSLPKWAIKSLDYYIY
jgi:exodeoxyribonuclease VIII